MGKRGIYCIYEFTVVDWPNSDFSTICLALGLTTQVSRDYSQDSQAPLWLCGCLVNRSSSINSTNAVNKMVDVKLQYVGLASQKRANARGCAAWPAMSGRDFTFKRQNNS